MSTKADKSSGLPSTGWSIPIVALGAIALTAITVAFLYSAKGIIESRKAALLREEVRAGNLLLEHLAGGAVYPLLVEDSATLGQLVKAPSGMASFLFAFIADADNVVLAHTDPANVGGKPALPSGGTALHLSRPLVLRNTGVGSAHLVLRRDILEREADRATDPLRRSLAELAFLALAGLALLAGLAAAGGRRLRRSLAAPFPGREKRSVYRLRSIDARLSSDLAPASAPEGGGTGDDPLPEPRISQKPATVLVTSFRGFRGYAESRSPEEILSDINGCIEIAEAEVEAQGGRIERFCGDTAVAVFGGASPLPDHTSRAVQAALAVQKALRDAEGKGNPLFGSLAIGVSSGVVLSCEGGGGARTNSIVIGECIKSAESLAMVAGPGEIVIGREVYQYLGKAVAADPLPPRESQNRVGAWENYRLQDTRGRGG